MAGSLMGSERVDEFLSPAGAEGEARAVILAGFSDLFLLGISYGRDQYRSERSLFVRSGGILFSGALRIISGPVYCEEDSDMDFQIHCIEIEAYGAVLRAFIAQSEVLSWDKEELITELRKELRVSDVEHREILGKINLDDSFKSIREWRKGSDGQHLSAMNPPASRKRLKPEQTPVASSPKYLPRPQPSPMHVKDGLWNINTSILYPQIPGGPVVPVPQNRQSPRSGKVRGSVAMQTSKKGVARSGFGNMKPGSDIFEIRATDKLINEVEKICGGANPDPSQIERARLILREHERALMDAIAKLADVSDGDDLPDHIQKQHQYSNEERDSDIQGFHNCAY